MKKASIDIGSNSVLLLAMDKDTILIDESRITGLGKNIDDTKLFSDESMDATFSVLSEYKTLLADHQIRPEDVIITATEASRVVNNSGPFFKKIKEQLGFNIQLISGAGEAFYTAKGVLSGFEVKGSENFLIIDIGGASTELIKIDGNGNIIYDQSFPMGSVRCSDWILKGNVEDQLSKVINSIAKENYQCNKAIGVAGTIVSLAMILLEANHFSREEVDGYVLKLHALKSLWKEIEFFSPQELLSRFPILGKRSSSLLGGLVILMRVMEHLDQRELFISARGLRYGTLLAGKIDTKFGI